MAKDRACEECEDRPIIKGKSWGSHTRDNHNNRKDVKYSVIDSNKFKNTALN